MAFLCYKSNRFIWIGTTCSGVIAASIWKDKLLVLLCIYTLFVSTTLMFIHCLCRGFGTPLKNFNTMGMFQALLLIRPTHPLFDIQSHRGYTYMEWKTIQVKWFYCYFVLGRRTGWEPLAGLCFSSILSSFLFGQKESLLLERSCSC